MDSGKRRYQRFIVEKLGIYAKTLYVEETELLNISMTGACISARESLKLSNKHLIKLYGKGRRLTLPCKVIWERASHEIGDGGGEGRFYRAGLEFGVSSSDKLVILKDFIRLSGIPDEQKVGDEYQPSALRFKVYANEKALVYYPKVSRVRKLSLGGMLMESDKAIEVDNTFPMALLLPRVNFQIKFQGRVACCTEIPDKKPKLFDIGIEFLGMAENDKAKLSEFLQTLAVRPLHEKLWELVKKICSLRTRPKRAD